MERVGVSLLGATGSVGQRFVTLLARHPWFELVRVAASPGSVGRPYGAAVRWLQAEPIPPRIAALPLEPCEPDGRTRLAFSALDAAVAEPIERAFAAAGQLVVTNARPHRLEPSVPLLVPEVNPDALERIENQTFGDGAIVANPNCTSAGLVLALAPLHRRFGVRRVHVVSLQALSGAGLSGPSAFAMADNVLPFIDGEEEKLVRETRKILGDIEVSATCNRVPVVDGHTLCVSLELDGAPSTADVVDAWTSFRGLPQELGLPSAPERPTRYLSEPDSPQPRLHRDLDGGMATAIGRLRPCPLLGLKFTALTHNTLRGAAGGAVLSAELAVRQRVRPFND